MALDRPTAILADEPLATGSREAMARLVGGRTKSLDSVHPLLTQALDEARAADEPLLAYLIEMAIVEANARSASRRSAMTAVDRLTS